jgi:hypothetical protein
MGARNLFIFAGAIILTGLTACFPLLSGKGELVHVEHNREAVRHCRYAGTVSGTSSVGLNREQKTGNAMNEVKNKAARLGADTVLIISMDSMFEGPLVRGEAYDCR